MPLLPPLMLLLLLLLRWILRIRGLHPTVLDPGREPWVRRRHCHGWSVNGGWLPLLRLLSVLSLLRLVQQSQQGR